MMIFKESESAKKYCKGKGIELGRAAHNPFNLEDCINVAPEERQDFWKQSQFDVCGTFAPIDLYGTAESIPVEDHTYDYIISSHVIEHVPNPIKAFLEWDRVLKDKGIIYMIFPKRGADKNDIGRQLSPLMDFVKQYNDPQPLTDEHRHIWVFDLDVMLHLIRVCNDLYGLKWRVIDWMVSDDKIGNGHVIVAVKE